MLGALDFEGNIAYYQYVYSMCCSIFDFTADIYRFLLALGTCERFKFISKAKVIKWQSIVTCYFSDYLKGSWTHENSFSRTSAYLSSNKMFLLSMLSVDFILVIPKSVIIFLCLFVNNCPMSLKTCSTERCVAVRVTTWNYLLLSVNVFKRVFLFSLHQFCYTEHGWGMKHCTS
mgnify:CR=1 FL=1